MRSFLEVNLAWLDRVAVTPASWVGRRTLQEMSVEEPFRYVSRSQGYNPKRRPCNEIWPNEMAVICFRFDFDQSYHARRFEVTP